MESVVRSKSRLAVVLAVFAGFAFACASSRAAATIEAVKGKHYKLTKRHGPWMIMVASFIEPPDDRRGEGLSPEQAAQQLVYELRLHHIPSYVFRQEEVDEEVQVIGRRTMTPQKARVRNWTGGICVLAGNYPSANDKVAQDTLHFIKEFQPDFLSDVEAAKPATLGGEIKRSKSGGIFRTTKDRPKPLSGAFMTTNPLLSDEELAVRRRDPFIIKLNSGGDYSLLSNPGRYTVVIATFQGRFYTQFSKETPDDHKFELTNPPLSDAAERAWELCTALRHARSLGYDREFESYVYHDRYSSIVTVGSFDSKDDPRIASLQNFFGGKVTQVKTDGTPTIAAEPFTVPRVDPRHPRPSDKSVKTFIFDAYPEVIDVPK
jgi:hypothetical protein